VRSYYPEDRKVVSQQGAVEAAAAVVVVVVAAAVAAVAVVPVALVVEYRTLTSNVRAGQETPKYPWAKQLWFVPTLALALGLVPRHLYLLKELQSATQIPVSHFVLSTIRLRQSYGWRGAPDGSNLFRQE
jgi:hypothetical protein